MESSAVPMQEPVSPVTKADKGRLDRSLVHGMAWVGGVKWAGQGLTWISTILVARILTPADYGLVAMAIAFIVIVSMVADFGVDLVVVNFRGLDSKEMSQINGFSLGVGAVAFLFSCLVAVPLSWYFHAPEVQWIVIAMASNFLFQGLKAVPYALLQKEMQFKRIAIIESIQTFVQAGSAITLAVLGVGYWALVAGPVLGPAVAALLVLKAKSLPFAKPELGKLKAQLAYGRDVVLSRFCWITYTNADSFVVGRVLGPAALGAYTFALTLANVAVEKVSGISTQVTGALFAAVQHDHAATRRYLLVLTEGFAVVSFPVTFGLALVADELIPVMFGAKWAPMILPLQILSFMAAYRSVVSLPSQIIFAKGDSKSAVRNGIIGVILIPLGFIAGSQWGIVGVTMVWVTIYPPISYHLSVRVFASIELSHKDYWRAFLPAATASAVMAVIVLGSKLVMPDSWGPLARLVCEIGVGGVAYVVVVWLGFRQRIQQFIALVRR